MSDRAYDAPLSGVRVIDLASGPMLQVGRLLADLGAEVTHVDLAGVSRPEAFGPVVDGVSVYRALAEHGTTHTKIDPGEQGGTAAWARLLDSADILIETTEPGSAAESALDVQRIRAARPGLIVLSISPFGRGNPFSEWRGTSPVFTALTSELSRSGIPGRDPVLPPGELPYDVAAAQAAFLTVSLFLDRLRTGVGALADFSVLEGAMQALDPPYGMSGSASLGQNLASLPRGRVEARHQYPIIACADGYVRICILAKRQWQGMFEWMGRPAAFADPKYDNLMERFAAADLVPTIARFFADKTRVELEEQGQLNGVPIAGVLSVEEALDSPQIRAREFFREIELAPGLVAPAPAGVMEIDGVRASTLTRDRAAAGPRVEAAPILAGRPRADQGRPLEGVRVLDFGVIIVGGDTGRLLGDLGADVVKIENSSFIDGSRASLPPGGMAPGYASGHRNKRSVGVNLRDPEGLEIVRRLVAESDIVLTNFKPGVIANLGLDFESLKSANPGIVVVDSSAFGPTGPWAKRLGYGPLVRAATGFTEQWVYPGEPGSFSDAVTVYPDHVCSRIGALGALALLVRRERTGRGGSVSISQAEVMMSGMAPKLAADALAAAGHHASAPGSDTPWGIFPAAGDDEWVAVTVRDDDEWRALARTIGRPDLADDKALADEAGRAAAAERINAAVAEWTSGRPPLLAMELLQEAGVPAGAMLRAIDIPEWAFYRLRRDFREELHPLADAPYIMENVQIHAEHIADPPLRQAPLLGEQTAEVLEEVLGMDRETVDALLAKGVLESTVVPVRV